ncbi:hypothetical protein M8C21_006035 [Ambrosia artemisiifolia]|uniref:FBD domain-containing protein n=1 Tax=Ambrosia artemisiifolia TaxID=4212 RepID=A0AAD5GT23_AMBAR|nr:hypothetical protein M8C21_006035 [Ambrosia artemisiifolia]
MVTVSSNHICTQLEKFKLVNAIFHVLLFHNGPHTLVFACPIVRLHMESEFAQITSYLARGNKVKYLVFGNDNRSYKLPIPFFSLQGLERVHLETCTFEPPLTFKGFSLLTSITLFNVDVSAKMLKRFISMCPLLQYLYLNELQKSVDSVAGGNEFTFVDILPCVPLIQTLDISKYYTKYLYAGGMPHKLPASLVHLKGLYLYVCLMEENEISSALCMMRSSPVLEVIVFKMYDNYKLHVRQTLPNFLDPKGHPDLKLDRLETLVIEMFSNLSVEMDFVKLIMAKSPTLKKVRIELNGNVSVKEELEMLRELVLNPIPRASPSAKLSVVRPNTS